MGYFEAISESYFRRNTEGQILFYPWGFFGKGYIVPDEEQKKILIKFFKRAGIVSLLYTYLVLFISKRFGFIIGFGFFILYTFAYYIVVQTLTRKFEKTEEKLPVLEFYANQSRSLSYLNIVLLGLGSLLFIVAGVWLIINGKKLGIGILTIIFFGMCFIVSLYQLKKKIAERTLG